MKKNQKVFVLVEILLAAAVLSLMGVMVARNYAKPHKVAVILKNSDGSQWAALKYGLKQAAKDEGINLVIAGTGLLETAEDEEKAMQNEIDNGADALIVQPSPGDDTGKVLKKMSRKVPVLLVESDASGAENQSYLPVISADNAAMGQSVAEEVLSDFSGHLDGKKVGILSGSQDSAGDLSKEQSCLDAVTGGGGTVGWILRDTESADDLETQINSEPKADIIIALNNTALEAAGKCASSKNLHGALLYGIGSSTEAVYYLDHDIIRAMIVPNEFLIGYRSISSVAGHLDNYFRKMESRTEKYTVLRRESLFTEQNQQLLFAISQ